MKKIFVMGEKKDSISYYNSITACGAQVIYGFTIADTANCDALMLTGGADLNPQLYGEENTASKNIDDARDAFELELVKHFSDQNKPILGICRGIQVLNVAFGSNLIQNIEHAELHNVGDGYDKAHLIKLSGPSFLRELYGDEFSVNSAHHQAVKIPADGFDIVAYSEDGIVEAMVHKTKPIVAVQFHPERMSFEYRRQDAVDGKPIFDYFLSLI
ncbi:MAG: type 1 glutamine amidotransferase [Oscillospiraceae bacterium]